MKKILFALCLTVLVSACSAPPERPTEQQSLPVGATLRYTANGTCYLDLEHQDDLISIGESVCITETRRKQKNDAELKLWEIVKSAIAASKSDTEVISSSGGWANDCTTAIDAKGRVMMTCRPMNGQ